MTEHRPPQDDRMHIARDPAAWQEYFTEIMSEDALERIGRGDPQYLRFMQDEGVAALNVLANEDSEERKARYLDALHARQAYEQYKWPGAD